MRGRLNYPLKTHENSNSGNRKHLVWDAMPARG